jgi:hypothetical protein
MDGMANHRLDFVSKNTWTYVGFLSSLKYLQRCPGILIHLSHRNLGSRTSTYVGLATILGERKPC